LHFRLEFKEDCLTAALFSCILLWCLIGEEGVFRKYFIY